MPLPRIRRLTVLALICGVVLVTGTAGAWASRPVFVDDATPTASSPLLDDGTVSFSAYGLLTTPTATSSIRARFATGDLLAVELLVPDQAPENGLDPSAWPVLRVVAPDGTTTTVPNELREPFTDPASQTGYLRLARLTQPVPIGGIYTFTVTSGTPTRFVVSVGTRDAAGSVTDYTEPPSGALQAWYATPPPDAATLGAGGSSGSGGEDLDLSRLNGPRVDDSSPGRAAGLPLGIAALAIMAVTITIFVKARNRNRSRGTRPPEAPAPPDATDRTAATSSADAAGQLSDGSGG